MLTEIGPVEIEVPRDTNSSFDPQIVKKRQRGLTGIDEIVLSLTAKGLTIGEVAAHFADVYGATVSKDLPLLDMRLNPNWSNGKWVSHMVCHISSGGVAAVTRCRPWQSAESPGASPVDQSACHRGDSLVDDPGGSALAQFDSSEGASMIRAKQPLAPKPDENKRFNAF